MVTEPEPRGHAPGLGLLAPGTCEAMVRETRKVRKDGVRGDRSAGHQPFLAPLAGNKGDATTPGLEGRAGQGAARDLGPAGRAGAIPQEQMEEVGLACVLETHD